MNDVAFAKVLVALTVIVSLIILSRYSSSKADPEIQRRKNLAALARKLDLKFDFKSSFKLADEYAFLHWLTRGNISYVYNIFYGHYSGYPVTVFDYTFAAGQANYYWSAFVLKMKTNFPDTIISHESMESRFAEKLGESHIVLESAEFSHSFRLRSMDKKFAFEVCHPRMMEYLLANKDLTIEINGTAVAVLFEDWLRPDKVELNLSRLIEIRKLMPEYLFANT